MEKIETHDFMKVESFSQLPLTRPVPVKEKGVRLFGIDFCQANACKDAKDNKKCKSSPRFECHYCFRNFPTSQALGGHQNAHKRERQHAKRAHLQSAMVHNTISDSNPPLYRLLNYRLDSLTYPSWKHNSMTAGSSSRTHGGRSSFSDTCIKESLASWSFNRDRFLMPSPLLSSDGMKQGSMGVYSSPSPSVYDSKPSIQEHVSLDLHL